MDGKFQDAFSRILFKPAGFGRVPYLSKEEDVEVGNHLDFENQQTQKF